VSTRSPSPPPLPLLLFLLPLCVLCDLCGRFWASFTVHTNASKRALIVIALLRKNALFVGHKEGGEHLGLKGGVVVPELHTAP
jgi:hypothetical protein